MKNENDKDLAVLRTMLRRPREGRAPALFEADPETVIRILMWPRDEMIKRQIALGQAAGMLPQGALPQERKAQLRRIEHPRLAMCVRAYRDALEAAMKVEGFRGPDPARIGSVHARMGIFEKLRRGVAESLNGALDARLLIGAFSSYVLYGVAGAVSEVLADPDLPAGKRGRLRDAFSRLLAFREQLALRAQQTRAANKAALSAARAEAEVLEGDLLLKHVAGALKRGEAVPAEQVARAAALWEKREEKAAKGEDRKRKR